MTQEWLLWKTHKAIEMCQLLEFLALLNLGTIGDRGSYNLQR